MNLLLKTSHLCTTQKAKMGIDPAFVDRTANIVQQLY